MTKKFEKKIPKASSNELAEKEMRSLPREEKSCKTRYTEDGIYHYYDISQQDSRLRHVDKHDCILFFFSGDRKHDKRGYIFALKQTPYTMVCNW